MRSVDTDTDTPQDVKAPHAGQPEAQEQKQAEAQDEEERDQGEDGYRDADAFGPVVSGPALALAGFVFAVAALLGGMIPQALPFLVEPVGATPAANIRVIGYVDLGFALVALAFGAAALLRLAGEPAGDGRWGWPAYVAGATVLLAFLIALESVLLLGLAAYAPSGTPG